MFPRRDPLPTLIERRAGERPEAPYVLEGDDVLTYSEFNTVVAEWAEVLTAWGVRSGSKVVTILPTSAAALAIWIALARLGALEVAMNPAYRGDVLRGALADVAPDLVMTSPHADALADLPEQRVRVEIVDVAGHPQPGPDLARAAPSLTQPRDHDLATVIFTSGTTGRSKGVLVPWRQLADTAWWSWPTDGMSDADRWYSPWPLFHVSGKVGPYTAALAGGSVVLRDGFRASEFWPDVRRYRTTLTILPGTTLNFLYSRPVEAAERDNPLRGVYVAPLPPDPQAVMDRFGIRICTAFNMSELGTPIVSGWWPSCPTDSCGRLRPGASALIVDENDEPVPVGEAGELAVRSDETWGIMAGYIGRADATVAAWRNLWFHTGDRFRVDSAGNYYWLGRIHDSLRRRGENISAAEVEAAVVSHPAVAACAVIGAPGDHGDQEVHAVVVADEAVTARDIWAHTGDRLPKFMVPRFITFVDSLPLTPTRRVRKHDLAEIVAGLPRWDALDASTESTGKFEESHT